MIQCKARKLFSAKRRGKKHEHRKNDSTYDVVGNENH